jgi:hypothetical protein
MRLTRSLATSLCVVLLLAGCGGDNSNGSGASSNANEAPRTSAETTTTRAPTTTTTVRAVKQFSSKELQALLVPLSELPSGFSVYPPDEDDDDTKLCGQPSIEDVVKSKSEAEITYAGGQAGPLLFEVLGSFATTENAAKAMRTARSAFGGCKKFDDTDEDGTVTHYTVAEMSFSKLADDQLAYRMTLDAQGANGTFDLVAARADNVIMLTGGLSVFSILGPGQLQPGVFESFTEKAFKRIDT